MKPIYLIILVFLAASINLSAQDQLTAVSKKSGKTHILKVPDEMKLGFYGNVASIEVSGMESGGLVTSSGFISFDKLAFLRATRKKTNGERVIGVVLGLGGLFFSTLGIASLATDYATPASSIVIAIAGAAVAYGGFSMASARRTYDSDKWDFRIVPSENGLVPEPVER